VADWRSRLEGLVRRGRDIPPPGNTFAAAKPLASPWPKAVPTNDALSAFYARCNGGALPSPTGLFNVLPRGQLAAASRQWRGRLWDAESEAPLGDRVVVLGFDDVGGLAWDPDADRVYLFHTEGGAAELTLDASLEAFLARVFDPDGASGPAGAEWAAALCWVDAHAEPGGAPDPAGR
jgi:hypothetical protein